MKCVEVLINHVLDVEVSFGTRTPSNAIYEAPSGIGDIGCQCSGQSRDITSWHKGAALITADLWQRASCARDNRQATRHRLHGGHAKALEPSRGGDHSDVTCGPELWHIRHCSYERDPLAQRWVMVGVCAQLGALWPVASDMQAPRGRQTERSARTEEDLNALAGSETRSEPDPDGTITLARRLYRRTKALQVDSVIDAPCVSAAGCASGSVEERIGNGDIRIGAIRTEPALSTHTKPPAIRGSVEVERITMLDGQHRGSVAAELNQSW